MFLKVEKNKPEACAAVIEFDNLCAPGGRIFSYYPSSGACLCCKAADALTNTLSDKDSNIYSSPTPNPTYKKAYNMMAVEGHNNYRRAHQVADLKWQKLAAEAAQKWAEKLSSLNKL